MRAICLIIAFHFFFCLDASKWVDASLDASKCGACEAVGYQLSLRLANERPRNHIDTRHRLDKDGKRWGKVLDYKISELRAIELLDDICDTMNQFQPAPGSTEEQGRWVLSSRLSGDEKSALNRHQLKDRRQRLRNSCADIIGRFEEDLAEAIKEGHTGAASVKNYLCAELAGYCPAQEDPPIEGEEPEEQEAMGHADEL